MPIGTTNYPAAIDTAVTLIEARNNASGTLASAIDADDVAIALTSLSDANEFPATGNLSIDNEIIYYDAKSGVNFTSLTRGVDGSTAAAHSVGASVNHFVIAASHRVQNDAIVAIQTKLGSGADTPVLNDFLMGSGAGASLWQTPTVATAALNSFVGDSGSGGTKGLVPAPASGDAAAGKVLAASGGWVVSAVGSAITDLTGDVTATGPGSVAATIANDAVTFAKFQNITDNRLLGRSAGSGGDMQEITVGSGLSLSGGSLTAVAVSSNPFDDATAIIKGSADATKLLRFEVDGFTTGTTRVLTPPNSDGTIAITQNNLSVFAATTSAQLAGVISDETGSGALVFGTAPSIAGGTHTALTSLGIRSTGTGAFDLTIANSENLTAGRTLTVTLNDAARTLNLGGNLTTAADFSTSGANALTLTTSGATNVTLPTTGTLTTLAGSETLSNKTLTTPIIASFTNATHTHADAAGGGTLNAAVIAAGILPIARGGTGTGTAPADGKLLIGKTDGSYAVANLTQGANITITNGDGTITIAGAASGANTALSNLASVSINESLIPQAGKDLGAEVTPWRDFWLYGSGTFGTHSFKLTGTPTAHRVLTLPNATDTLVGKATTDTFTNKTFDTAGSGNSFSINGLAATANTGTGDVVRATSPTLVTPVLGAATATSLVCPTLNGGTAANDDITIQGTSNATRTTSYVLLQPNGGNVGIGTSTFGTSAANGVISITNAATAPLSQPADVVQVWADDTGAGDARLRILGESGSRISFGNNQISFATSATDDVFLSRAATANLRIGAPGSGAAIAQTLSVQNSVGTNVAGANWTRDGSQGTGTGAGGSHVWRVAAAGGSGSGSNGLATAMTLNSSSNLGLGTSAPLARLNIQSATGTNQFIAFSGADIAHSFTALLDTSIGNRIGFCTSAGGGFLAQGFSDADLNAVRFQGSIGSASPTKAAIVFEGFKSDGSTNRTAMTGSEILAQFGPGDIVTTPANATVTYLANGNVGFGTSTFGTSAAKVIAITNTATAPSSQPADIGQFWCSDFAATKTVFRFLGESGSRISIGDDKLIMATGTTDDAFLGRAAAASWRYGDVDAASPVAQALSVQSVVAGTSNTAGVNWTRDASRGTGTGAGGSHIWRVAPAGSSGTSQNALVASMTLDSTHTLTLAEAFNFALGTTTGTKIGTVGGGSGQKLAFLGSTPVVQQVLATGAGATVDNVITFLQTIGLCRQS